MGENARPTVTLSDLQRLSEQDARPNKLTADEVEDFAVAALIVLRGMRRGDKIRVLAKARRLLG
jgi:hypothetical protein